MSRGFLPFILRADFGHLIADLGNETHVRAKEIVDLSVLAEKRVISGVMFIGACIGLTAELCGGLIIIGADGKPMPIIVYQYPTDSKADKALQETISQVLLDADSCVCWINEIPKSPYSTQQLKNYTGNELGVEILRPPKGPTTISRESVTKVGRNDPCPCGSGKKYKKCCLQ